MKRRSNLRPLTGTRAVVRAVSVLKALGRSASAYGVTELGIATGLSKATVFRLLGALENEGMVARDGHNGSYRLGPEMISLGTSALSTTHLREIAHFELVRLTEESGETSTLEVLSGNDVLVIDEVQGRFLFSATPEIGRRWPIHATSTGKVLLAFAQTTRSLPRLAKHGPRTITTHAELDRELERVRQHGYAFAVDELETGLVAMAAPIKNHLGHVVAAVSLNGPSSRLTPKRRRQLQAKLCAAAKRVSRRLGATTPVASASDGHRAEIAL
jgi:DNA-binding IclR family transcriptional regulator